MKLHYNTDYRVMYLNPEACLPVGRAGINIENHFVVAPRATPEG